MRTNDIVKISGLDRETLRFYQSKGLLTGIKRSPTGYRIFPEKTLTQLQFIQLAKLAGFTLTEIKELMDLQNTQASCRQSRDMAQTKRAEISQKLKALKKMDKTLTAFIKGCEKNGETGLDRACHFSFEDLK